LVQSELHPEDEGREGDGNPGEPNADAPAARVPEVVAAEPEQPVLRFAFDPDPPLRRAEPPSADAAPAAPVVIDAEPGTPTFDAPPPAVVEEAALLNAVDASVLNAADAAPALVLAEAPADAVAIQDADLRLTSPGIRVAQVKEELVAWVKTLISAAVYAILIVTFGVQVARVEGQSMAPTLEDQDRLIVNKLVYRIGEPRRGDIVMLYYPLNPEKSFVKRVIAEEGDTVRIVDGRVYVNDIPLKDDYVPSEFRSHDDWGPQVIPEGYYFVMGDHRNNSSDSRHWGMVPKKYIIGKVQLRWWPVPTARVF
jgi:signal peptidase I